MKTKSFKIDAKELDEFRRRLENRCLLEKDYEFINGLLRTIIYLRQKILEKGLSIKRILRQIFGLRTENSKNVLGKGKSDNQNTSNSKNNQPTGEDVKNNSKGNSESKNPKGHGRNGVDAYTGADKISVSHTQLANGGKCPNCLKGKIYCQAKPGLLLNLFGRPPIQANIYELEKLRCNICGKVYTAEPPTEAADKRYDETAGAMIALLKYGGGTPFYRINKLQQSLGVPLPASSQWDVVEKAADKIYPVYRELIRQAAQGEVIHNDDTNMKILSLMTPAEDELQRQGKKKRRTGTFTSGIFSIIDNHQIALFFTGTNHAGENINNVLRARKKDLKPPIQMCDALSRNAPKEFEVILAHCLVHARRNFVDINSNFPEECRYVIETLAKVYKNDEITKTQNMSPLERMNFHQLKSAPIMTELKVWLQLQLDEKKAEPNSSLGKAISYMLKHWTPLTLFLRIPGAPLDNNICEQALKKAILHRKNSLFYKTQHGAFIGDIFMSLIHTCNLEKINPFRYLVTLQKNSTYLFRQPEQWLPWNYSATLQKIPP